MHRNAATPCSSFIAAIYFFIAGRPHNAAINAIFAAFIAAFILFYSTYADGSSQ